MFILSFAVAIRVSSFFITYSNSSSFAFAVVSSNASFGFGALAVLVLLKLLNSFISCRFFFCCCLLRSSFLGFSLLLRPLLFFFALNHFTRISVFHKIVAIFCSLSLSFSSVLCSLAPYYRLQCNFRLFAVRLYFFITHINIIDGCFICNVVFSPLSLSFSFPHSFNQMPTLPSTQPIHFLWLQNKQCITVVALVFSSSFISLLISTFHDWWFFIAVFHAICRSLTCAFSAAQPHQATVNKLMLKKNLYENT